MPKPKVLARAQRPGQEIIGLMHDRNGRVMVAGLVKDHKKVGCPKEDTIFLTFGGRNEPDHGVCIRPDEAVNVIALLSTTLVEHERRQR